jgi:hypothetical protein
MVLAFGILRAAMFAEPAVAKVEEVCGLMHLEDPRSQNPRSQMVSNFQIARKQTRRDQQNYLRKPITPLSGHRTTESCWILE